MRNTLCMVLALFMVMSLRITSSATENSADDAISIEEYEVAVQAECIKYGVECQILDYDPNIAISESKTIQINCG